MMHVIIGENLHDADYVALHTRGLTHCASACSSIRPSAWLPHRNRQRRNHPARARVCDRPARRDSPKLWLQRSERGAMAVRAISLLPAVTGSWKEVARSTLSTSGAFQINRAALERPTCNWRPPRREARIVNMVHLGRRSTN